MGKTKWYEEPETKHQQQGYRLQITRPTKRLPPGQHFWSELERLPISVLLRQIWLRIQRRWWALRFRFGRHMTEKNALKLGVLALASYLLFFQDSHLWSPQETRFASESIGGQSLLGLNEKETRKRMPANEAAPVGSKQLTPEMVADYVGRFGDIAQTEMQRYGVPASISLAQGLVESRAGTSKLAVRNNNHFGIKCFSRRCRKGHCSNFTDDSHKDFFRKFASPWESWRAHSQMISTGRYAKLKKHGHDYRKWAYGLKSLGYATDATYAEKLIGIIEAYDLHKYDK